MFKSWYEKLISKCGVKTPIYDTVINQLNSIHKDIQSILIDIKADKELLVKELCKKDVIIKTMFLEHNLYLPRLLEKEYTLKDGIYKPKKKKL
jgi:hypothetical protein